MVRFIFLDHLDGLHVLLQGNVRDGTKWAAFVSRNLKARNLSKCVVDCGLYKAKRDSSVE